VVWNLLANAIKFTPEGGCVRVVSARREWLAVTVSDTGQGIEPGLLPHVFERFRQGTDPASRLPGGLGLGLAIVRHLVEAHGGTVHAESAGRGCGATFTVELPLPASNADPLVPAGTEGDPIVVR
jgi:signal transduction histidine kinase